MKRTPVPLLIVIFLGWLMVGTIARVSSGDGIPCGPQGCAYYTTVYYYILPNDGCIYANGQQMCNGQSAKYYAGSQVGLSLDPTQSGFMGTTWALTGPGSLSCTNNCASTTLTIFSGGNAGDYLYLYLGEISNNNNGWAWSSSSGPGATLASMSYGQARTYPYNIEVASGHVQVNPNASGIPHGLDFGINYNAAEYSFGSIMPDGYASVCYGHFTYGTGAPCGNNNSILEFPMNAQTYINSNVWSYTNYNIVENLQWADVTYDFGLVTNGHHVPSNHQDFEIMIEPYYDMFEDSICALGVLLGTNFATITQVAVNASSGITSEWAMCVSGLFLDPFLTATVVQFIPDSSPWVYNNQNVGLVSNFVKDFVSSNGLNPAKYNVTGIEFGSEYGIDFTGLNVGENWYSGSTVSTFYLNSWELSIGTSSFYAVS